MSELDVAIKRLRTFNHGVHIAMAKELTQDVRADANSKFGSPVLSGRFAGSVRAAVGGELTGSDKQRPAGYQYSDGRVIHLDPIENVMDLGSFEIGDRIIIFNTLSYAELLEGGKSKKAPRGIYGVTTQNFKNTVARRMIPYMAALNAGSR